MSDESSVHYLVSVQVMSVVVLDVATGLCAAKEVRLGDPICASGCCYTPDADAAYERNQAARKAWMQPGIVHTKIDQ